MTDCDPQFKEELDRINVELDLISEMAHANETMQIHELFSEAADRGEAYFQGYVDGFWKGRELLFQSEDTILEANKQKHDELNRRWGLENL